MLRRLIKNALLLCLLPGAFGSAQQLSPKWEELTAADFVKALQSSSGVCLLPFGIIEKHGPSGPLGPLPPWVSSDRPAQRFLLRP
jgi:creatinine amidohydrolase